MVTQTQHITADDLWALAEDYEPSKGQLVEIMSPTSGLHGIIAARLGRILGNYVDEHALGIRLRDGNWVRPGAEP